MNMFELRKHEFAIIQPILAGIKQKVLPDAICEGYNLGRIFVDQPDRPHTALMWSSVGYYFLAGDPAQAKDISTINRVLNDIFVPASQASGETGFILIATKEAWKDHLPLLLPGREVIEIYRRPFTFRMEKYAAQGTWRERIPQGFCLQAMDANLAEQAGVLASWPTVNDFLTHGIGFALLHANELVSHCFSIFVSQARVEIDVHTEENYRRRGFAIITASALIEACLHRGKLPNWECFWDNDSSVSLAEKLGFSPLPDYPVYFWEV